MPITLREIQQLTIQGLHQVHADYAPNHKRYAFSATPDEEFGGRLIVAEDKFICYAILTRDQFEDLKDFCNGLGIWLAAHWKPFGRTNNKFEYELAATRLIDRAEWTKRKAENTVRCTIELIGEDPDNPTQGIVEVVRQLADQLEAKARMNGHAPVKFQLVIESDLTRGRATVRRQSDTERAGYETQVMGPRRPEPKAEAAGEQIPLPTPEPLISSGLETAPLLAVLHSPAPEPCPPSVWKVTHYGPAHMRGYIVDLKP